MFFSLLLYLKIDIKAGVSKLQVMMKWQKDSAALKLFAAVVVLISLFFSIFSQPRPGSLKGHLYTTRTPIYATVRSYFLYSF